MAIAASTGEIMDLNPPFATDCHIFREFGVLERGQAQVLLMCGFQGMIGNVAGFRHPEVAVVQRLGQDYGHQAVVVGNSLGVTRL
jgi:hypothetical protein